jgi:hypothetical protein
VLLAEGMMTGVLAGQFGGGGGVATVPILLEGVPAIFVPENTALPLAVGRVQACLPVTSLTAALAHWRAGMVDHALVRSWLPTVAFATAVGSAFGPFAPAKLLTGLVRGRRPARRDDGVGRADVLHRPTVKRRRQRCGAASHNNVPLCGLEHARPADGLGEVAVLCAAALFVAPVAAR